MWRRRRLGDLIRAAISDLLLRQVRDPRLQSWVTVTEVNITPDLKRAVVFVSILGSDEEKRQAMAALASAAGFFRREMAPRLKLRSVPEIVFQKDESIERGDRLLQLIKEVSPPQEQ